MTKTGLMGTVSAVALLLAFGLTGAVGSDEGLVAKVTSADGKVQRVLNLTGMYCAGSPWLRDSPKRNEESLQIQIEVTRDRVKATEQWIFLFADVRQIVLDGAEIPAEAKPILGNSTRDLKRIDMRDGRTILLAPSILIEMGLGEEPIKKTELDEWIFSAGEVQGQAMTLLFFHGSSKTEDRVEGKPTVFIWDVASVARIEFE